MANKIPCPHCKVTIYENLQFCPACGKKLHIGEFRNGEIGDLYKILQVDPSAESEVIQAAYKRLASKYHPDVNNSSDAQSRMQNLNKAYKILSNAETRREYDLIRKIHSAESREQNHEKNVENDEEFYGKAQYDVEKQREEKNRQYQEYQKRKKTTKSRVSKTQSNSSSKSGWLYIIIVVLVIICSAIILFIAASYMTPSLDTNEYSYAAYVTQTALARQTTQARPTIRPTSTKRSTQAGPQVNSDCYKWSEINSSMVGKNVCVYGIVKNILSNSQTATRIEFSDEPNTFFMYSVTLIFSNSETDETLGSGDCIYSKGTIDTFDGVIYMDLGEGEELYYCENWMKSSASQSSPIPTIAHPNTDSRTNNSDVEMIFVPEGEFIMGSESGQADEKPAHQVYLNAFYIDKYEVTNILYRACVDDGICKEPGNVVHYSLLGYEDHPVVYVDWYQAKTYCEWRNASLPTEAQWEKAARGADGRTYPWGDEIDCYKSNYTYYCGKDTTVVGMYEIDKSPYGLYDMAGNVQEWTGDWYSEYYYQESTLINPFGPISGKHKVVRGGSWNNSLNSEARLPYRQWFEPSSSSNGLGFRCAR